MTWTRYGRGRTRGGGEAQTLLDRFMPDYDVAMHHSLRIHAPAELTLTTACEMDPEDSWAVRLIFRTREFLLRARTDENVRPRGLLVWMKTLGWGVLAVVGGQEIVMGSATQPWEANPVFRPIPPEEFASFHESGYVKIAWTLRSEPLTATSCVFRTETRVFACGPGAWSKFRKYWVLFSPGMILIRIALLNRLKHEAERRAKTA